MVEAAPGMVQQAQQMAAAQRTAMQAQMARAGGMQPGTAPAGPDFEPIAGVSLDQFVAVSKGVAAFGYDQSKLPEVAASTGIPAYTWETAYKGWNDRIKSNPAVAQRFN